MACSGSVCRSSVDRRRDTVNNHSMDVHHIEEKHEAGWRNPVSVRIELLRSRNARIHKINVPCGQPCLWASHSTSHLSRCGRCKRCFSGVPYLPQRWQTYFTGVRMPTWKPIRHTKQTETTSVRPTPRSIKSHICVSLFLHSRLF